MRRLKVFACIAFASFHIAATLIRGASQEVRAPFAPVLDWYTEGLRMASTWGMFSKPLDGADAVVVGVYADRSRRELSHTDAKRRPWLRRIVDVRLRKIQNRLTEERDRSAWGREYLAYFCRTHASESPALRRVELEVVERSTEPPGPGRRALSVPCRAAR